MILLGLPDARGREHDLWLGASTAAVAGLVNVCAVFAFFAFVSNVTGHAAVLAQELVNGRWHQLWVVLAWLASFLGGAFVANVCITVIGREAPRLGRGLPIGIEMLVLTGVGGYGVSQFADGLIEAEFLIGALLFAMGLQNGAVSTISKGVVKTTHLTGLMTDLGTELSLISQRQHRHDERLRFMLKLHLVILGTYIAGGVAGGCLYSFFGFRAFFVAVMVLGLVLAADALPPRQLSTTEALLQSARHRALREDDTARAARSKGAPERSHVPLHRSARATATRGTLAAQ